MSIYRYAEQSVIQEAVFHHSQNRPPVALLTPAPDASPDQLSAIRSALHFAGWQSVPVYSEGKPTLQVSGFEQDSMLVNLLQANHFTQGQAAITPEAADNIKLSHADQVRQMGLKLAGLFNLVGNTGMVVDGIKKHDYFRFAGGSLLGLGAINLVLHGNAKPEYYQRAVAEGLGEFIHKHGGEVPQDSQLFDIMQHKRTGAFGKTEDFLREHPADVTLGIDSVGAGALLVSGAKKTYNKEGWGGLGFGIGSLGLKLLSLVLPEKSPEEIREDAAKTTNPIAKAVNWLREKPLRLYGLGSMASDVFLGIDAFEQYTKNPGKKGYIYTAVCATAYMLADIMYTISSKNHVNTDGKFNPDEQRVIEAMAAEYLVQQPEPLRPSMAQKLAGYLATRKEVQGNADSISRSIIEQARHMQDNPWTSRIAKDELYAPAVTPTLPAF